jgi:putative transposase
MKKEEDITFGKYQIFQMLASKSFANLFSSYSQAFNKVYKRKGSLFIPNFKRKEIISENNLLNVIGYIHRNPVHHGFVSRMEDWDYSSYNNILSDTNDTINSKEILELFGGKEGFIQYHNKYVDNCIDENLAID